MTADPQLEAEESQRVARIQRFTLILALAVGFLALIPSLVGYLMTPAGGQYLGAQTAIDDQMVYYAWMRQAMDGQLLFENRFAIESQPQLTFHLYFLLLGWLAKVVGIVAASTIARVGLSVLFVFLLGRFVLKLRLNTFTAKFAMFLGVFGSGFGYAVWQAFGREATNKGNPVAKLTGGWLPIDVWQPEAFVFPSMLVNGLFMAALSLIVTIFSCALDARSSAKPVWLGAGCFAVLMNIHSYDVLLLALVFVGWLVVQVAAKDVPWPWIGRVALMACGALPPAAWFWYVLQNDPVFQARAATLTFAGTAGQIVVGILPLILLALVGPLLRRHRDTKVAAPIAVGVAGGSLLLLLVFASGADPGQYFVGVAGFAVLLATAVTAACLLARPDAHWNLLWSWALIGLIAPYFPALFQRKLAMGLALPWAILAAIGLAAVLDRLDRSRRNLTAALLLVITSATSLYWFQREMLFVRDNVANTTRHPVILSRDAAAAVAAVDKLDGIPVVAAMPGIAAPAEGGKGFATPFLPDLNPIVTGLTGARSVAGHWSETPDYATRARDVTSIFLASTPDPIRQELLARWKLEVLIAPKSETFGPDFADLSGLGEVIYDGTQYTVIRLGRP